MMYLYFVRHGETIFNTYHRMQGWCDTPLTEMGRAQAMDVAEGLQEIPYTRVYASDSGRAIETARYIAKAKGCELCIRKGFREMFFGLMEGVDTFTGRMQNQAYRDTYGWVDVGGEDMQQLENRMFDTLQDIVQSETEEHIIIVTHGISIMSLIHRLDSYFFTQLQDYGSVLLNASVTSIGYENGRFRLLDFNDITYRDTGGKSRNEKNNQ